MANAVDAEGFSIPRAKSAPGAQAKASSTVTSVPIPTPSASVSASQIDRTGSVTSQSPSQRSRDRPVESKAYYDHYLEPNHVIFERNKGQAYPQEYAGLVGGLGTPSSGHGQSLRPEDIAFDHELQDLEWGPVEEVILGYFKEKLFPKPGEDDPFKVTIKEPMVDSVPTNPSWPLNISLPSPDMLFGFKPTVLSMDQKCQHILSGEVLKATKSNLLSPFLVIEYKGDQPMWVASNQVFGGLASSLYILHRLQTMPGQTWDHNVSDSLAAACCAFGIAMNGGEGRLYFSWKQEDVAGGNPRFVIRKVRSFALQEPDQLSLLETYIHNILQWGKAKRLEAIRMALDKMDVSRFNFLPDNAGPGRKGEGGSGRSTRRNSAASGMSLDASPLQ